MTGCLADGKAKTTLRWYQQRLQRLLRFFGDIPLKDITTADLRRFQVHLRENGRLFENHRYHATIQGSLSPATLASYVRAIKALYNWLERNEYITTDENVALRLKKPRIPKQAPKEASNQDVKRLLAAVSEGRKSDFLAKRDYAIVLFLVDTGCRNAGLVNLRLSDLFLDDRRALVTEKGSKSRFVFFSEATAAALREWVTVRPDNGSDRVFLSERGTLTATGVNQLLAKAKKRSGITGRVNPHSFRHRFAKNHLLKGGDLASLADMMGHYDVSVTKNSYSVFLTSELQRKHDQYSPLEDILD